MTQDQVQAKLDTLRKIKSSPGVQIWIDTVAEIRKEFIIQSYNEKGEEAVRALGTIKGLDIALAIETIYEARIKK